jgi:hypothetical protein
MYSRLTLRHQVASVIVLTSPTTFHARFVSHTTVEYTEGSIAHREPWRCDIVMPDAKENAIIPKQDRFELLRGKLQDGRAKLNTKFQRHVEKAFQARPADVKAYHQKAKSRAGRHRNRIIQRISEKQAKRTDAERKERKKESRKRSRAKQAAEAAEYGTGSADDSEGSVDKPIPKKQKTAPGTKAKKTTSTANKTSRGKTTPLGTDAGKNVLPTDVDNAIYDEIDAEDEGPDDSDADDDLGAAIRGVEELLDDLPDPVARYEGARGKFDAKEFWDAWCRISSEDEPAAATAVHKCLQAQEDYIEKSGKNGKKVKVVAILIGLPLEGIVFERIIVEEAQCVRNVASFTSRIVRLLSKHANALHLVSATPVLNRVDDIRSIALLA